MDVRGPFCAQLINSLRESLDCVVHVENVFRAVRVIPPPVNEYLKAEFHGVNAKLIWVVSLDGKKTQSETYKILAILDNRKSN